MGDEFGKDTDQKKEKLELWFESNIYQRKISARFPTFFFVTVISDISR